MNKCVLDIGMNDGEDTIMYLNQGYYVFSLEANPELIKNVKIPKEFEGKYEIFNFGISKDEEKIDFYVNHHSPWSSFIESIGIRKRDDFGSDFISGFKKVIKINTLTIFSFYEKYIKRKFNDIEYIKIDIEGKDHEALLGMNNLRPKFLSCEFANDVISLEKMKEMNYNKFNIVNQKEIIGKKTKITKVDGTKIEYDMPHSISGQFGYDLDNWVDYEIALNQLQELKTRENLDIWYDIHARL